MVRTESNPRRLGESICLLAPRSEPAPSPSSRSYPPAKLRGTRCGRAYAQTRSSSYKPKEFFWSRKTAHIGPFISNRKAKACYSKYKIGGSPETEGEAQRPTIGLFEVAGDTPRPGQVKPKALCFQPFLLNNFVQMLTFAFYVFVLRVLSRERHAVTLTTRLISTASVWRTIAAIPRTQTAHHKE